jgi:UPF0755 protein
MDEMKESKPGISLLEVKKLFGLDNHITKIVALTAFGIIFFVAVISFFLLPPTRFIPGSRVIVKEGMSLGVVSLLLHDENLISSRVLFEFCAITLGGDKKIMAGEYLFKEPIGGCALAVRIVGGVLGVPTVRVTIPEGLSNKEVAAVLAKVLLRIDTTSFLESARDKEGYLFPDTYFFPDNATGTDVLARMQLNFEKKIKPLQADITKSGRSQKDVVTMASILEKEVATDDDRAIVSGILWKRIDQSMPLQVDATFMYLLGKKSSELTQADLQTKSLYNTYRNRGLPPGPIGNPGLSALRAALYPKSSPYFYYLADANGITHYAETFDEHKANKTKYLR